MSNYNLEKRRYVIAFVATAIVVVYIVRLFTLQLLSDDYKKNADLRHYGRDERSKGTHRHA